MSRTESMDMMSVIDAYERGPDRLEWAVAGLNHEQLHAHPGPGDWSAHEVVIHLADSDAVSIERMKRIVAMPEPALLDYDENGFMRELHPAVQDLQDALVLFRTNRRQWVRVLRTLRPEQFERLGHHSVSGPVTLGKMVAKYVNHLEWHLQFILRKRERMGVGIAASEPLTTG